ncbi:hypothetical protein ASF30_12500 [Leifsonia sp. Leaf264]|nr:hypothetical protein ASF30_12500 [Leifsonia sp. Leaf264]
MAFAAPSQPTTVATVDHGPLQTITVPTGAAPTEVVRDNYTVVAYVPPPPPPPAPKPEPVPSPEPDPVAIYAAPPVFAPDPGSAQAIAHDMMAPRGWGEDQFGCLVALWDRESGWNAAASNSSSGAYGIPQSLPGSKMASAGADWETNPATQIIWGLGYIQERYGDPCGAWAHSESSGWY